MSLQDNIFIHLDQFDGPLGLLLEIVKKNEMDIEKLDIHSITSQYLEFIKRMVEIDFDEAAEFLYLATSLVHMKSEALGKYSAYESESLSMSSQDEIPLLTKENLIDRLMALDRYQKLGTKLLDKEMLFRDTFTRPTKGLRKSLVQMGFQEQSHEVLTQIFSDFLSKQRRQYTVVKRDRLSIKEKLESLKKRLLEGSQLRLDELVDNKNDSHELVITFISLLELARLQKVDLFQNEPLGEIYLEVKKSLDDFDIESANGFDDEQELNSKKEKEADQSLEQLIISEGEKQSQEIVIE